VNNTSRRFSIAAILLASTFALVVGGMGAAQLRHAMAAGPMLVAPSGIAVSDDGEIYTGVHGGHVFSYDASGELRNAWTVPTAEGRLRLALVDGFLHVASERAPTLHVYGLDGTALDSREEPDAFSRIGAEHDSAFRTASGELYALEGHSIVRREPAPAHAVVPAPRWPLRAFARHPFGLGLLLFAGAFGPIAALFVGRAGRPG
jgi:hypothetical protein